MLKISSLAREVAFTVESAREAPISPLAVSQEVVVEGPDITPDAGRVAVRRARGIVLVPRDVQALGDERPLGVMFLPLRELKASSMVQLIEL